MSKTKEQMRAGQVTLLLVGLAVTGCGDRLKLQSTRLSFDEFVNATVALRKAAAETNNPAEFQVRKRDVQRKLRFSDNDLKQFTRVHAGDVRVLSAAWDSVEARLDRPATATKAAPAATGPNAAGNTYSPHDEIVPGALPGGMPAVIHVDSLIPPPEDRLQPPAPPQRRPAPVKERKPFY